MCWVPRDASGSTSNRIDARARSPFSHGFGGSSVAQPASAAAAAIATITACSARSQQRTDLRLDCGHAVVVEPFLDRNDLAVAIDQVGTRHPLDVEGGR